MLASAVVSRGGMGIAGAWAAESTVSQRLPVLHRPIISSVAAAPEYASLRENSLKHQVPATPSCPVQNPLMLPCKYEFSSKEILLELPSWKKR